MTEATASRCESDMHHNWSLHSAQGPMLSIKQILLGKVLPLFTPGLFILKYAIL